VPRVTNRHIVNGLKWPIRPRALGDLVSSMICNLVGLTTGEHRFSVRSAQIGAQGAVSVGHEI
jgi:hypothetical protein